MDGSKLRPRFDDLWVTISFAGRCYEVWKELEFSRNMDIVGTARAEDWLRAVNEFPAFFKTTTHALTASMIIALNNFYVKSRRTNNFPRLLEDVLAQKGVPPATREAEEVLQQWRNEIASIKTIRDKVIAHKDIEVISQDLFAQYSLNSDNLGGLIAAGYKVLNLLSDAAIQLGYQGHSAREGSETRRLVDTLIEANRRNGN
jgi:AbiU2